MNHKFLLLLPLYSIFIDTHIYPGIGRSLVRGILLGARDLSNPPVMGITKPSTLFVSNFLDVAFSIKNIIEDNGIVDYIKTIISFDNNI